jgi:hypothetical protein
LLTVGGGFFRYRSGEIVLVDFMVSRGRRECLGSAVSVRGCRTTFFSRCQAAVDAVAIGIVGDKKPVLLGMRSERGEVQQGDETDQNYPHNAARKLMSGVGSATDRENAIKIVNRHLTVRSGRSWIFSRVLCGLSRVLDGAHVTHHCAAMNGLNHICGICPEIIR